MVVEQVMDEAKMTTKSTWTYRHPFFLLQTVGSILSCGTEKNPIGICFFYIGTYKTAIKTLAMQQIRVNSGVNFLIRGDGADLLLLSIAFNHTVGNRLGQIVTKIGYWRKKTISGEVILPKNLLKKLFFVQFAWICEYLQASCIAQTFKVMQSKICYVKGSFS